MKITRLQAEKVHGYLPLDIEFLDELTFLTGLNGSGKTTVLRLLMALLTPNIDELGAINFVRAIATVEEGDAKIAVTAEKSADGVTLSISGSLEELYISSAELELYMDIRRRDEVRSPIAEKLQQNEIFKKIRAISTPMFLGIDRRFYAPASAGDDVAEARRREYLSRRMWTEDPVMRAAGAALADVNFLVVTKVQEVRAAQEQLDDKLRAQFFAKAFEYKPADFAQAQVRVPSRAEIDRYRAQLATIERMAGGAKIPIPAIQSALSVFFERMGQIVDAMEKDKLEATKENTKRNKKKAQSDPFSVAYVEWLINKPHADRILEHLNLLEKYISERDSLRDPITRFLSLINGFFKQTNKVVSVANNGQLTVSIEGNPESSSIGALSSGERQLLVMLANLSLNQSLSGSGVFIVDEPELSLHIDWQEKFVDAIREANPKVQLILATHSPAIILDRVESCRTLTWGSNA